MMYHERRISGCYLINANAQALQKRQTHRTVMGGTFCVAFFAPPFTFAAAFSASLLMDCS